MGTNLNLQQSLYDKVLAQRYTLPFFEKILSLIMVDFYYFSWVYNLNLTNLIEHSFKLLFESTHQDKFKASLLAAEATSLSGLFYSPIHLSFYKAYRPEMRWFSRWKLWLTEQQLIELEHIKVLAIGSMETINTSLFETKDHKIILLPKDKIEANLKDTAQAINRVLKKHKFSQGWTKHYMMFLNTFIARQIPAESEIKMIEASLSYYYNQCRSNSIKIILEKNIT
jgi:hypothetical protein